MEEKENTENAEMGKRKHSHDTKIVIKYYYERIRQNTGNFLKWIGLSVLTGLVVGGASAVFAGCIKAATEYRDTHNWIFMLLPVAGVLIVFMYEKIGRQDGGTNQVLATIKSKDDVPFLSAPLIFVSTLLTHLTGGSAGREGASIQFGGSIGNWLVRHERGVFSTVWNTDGSSSFCNGSCERGGNVLRSTSSLCDCSYHCSRVCNRNGD